MEDGPPVFSAGSTCPLILWIQVTHFGFRLRDSHTLRSAFPHRLTTLCDAYTCPYPSGISTGGLASSDFARHYSRNLIGFLFLRLLRCFSSAGSLPLPMDSLTDPQFFTAGVSPFGNPRINTYFQFPVAYRRLSRPSSALGAKAFTLCSFSLEQPLLLDSLESPRSLLA